MKLLAEAAEGRLENDSKIFADHTAHFVSEIDCTIIEHINKSKTLFVLCCSFFSRSW